MQKHNQNNCPFSAEEIAAFADHAAEGKAKQNEIAAHLLVCGRCAALAKKLYADGAALQRLQTKAPEGFLAAVMANVSKTEQTKSKRAGFRRLGFGFAAAAMLFLVVGIGWQSRFGTTSQENLFAGADAAKSLTNEAAGANAYYDEETADFSPPKGSAFDRESYLPAEALFPEANALLLVNETVWETAAYAATEMLRVETEEGGFLAAFSVSAAEFETLRSKGQLLRENPQQTGERTVYIVLVALPQGE